MICIRNRFHKKTDDVCRECLKTIGEFAAQPQMQELEPELRALFTQLTLQNRDLFKCWKSNYKFIKIFNKRLRIENVYYAFYKADIGNEPLKKICGTPGCVNPAHRRSRYEPEFLKTQVRSGFNRKLKSKSELSVNEWLRHA